jgi:thiamine biosynthesis lipoprotein
LSEEARPSARLPLRVRVLLLLSALLLAWASYQLYSQEPELTVLELHGEAMGTTWSIKLASAGLGPDLSRATSSTIVAKIGGIDGLMSTWSPTSQLSQFNAGQRTDPFRVASELLEVLEISREVSLRSGGAFDVTVGPLVQAWGFGSEGRRSPPDAQTLSALRERVGYQKLTIDSPESSIAKQHPALEVDLSAVAKGYAVDELARSFEELGHEGFLIEIGGELRARGVHLDGRPWRVAIETPDSPDRPVHRIVELRGLSMATSGDYRNYYEHEGRRVSHTIDPRTGRPIEHRLASVTVLHPEAAWADAWATALNVLGPVAGYDLAVAQGLPAYLIVRSESGKPGEFEIRVTPAFEPYLTQGP